MLYFTGGSLLRSAKTNDPQTGGSSIDSPTTEDSQTKDARIATKLVDNILCKDFPGCKRILRVIRVERLNLLQYVIISKLGFSRDKFIQLYTSAGRA